MDIKDLAANNDICTIYLLTNKVDNMIYVGQTWLTLSKRMGPDGCNYKNSPHLYNAIQKHGAINFEYTVLEECNTQEDADRLEDECMVKYDSRNPLIGYNLKSGGSAGQHSEETKQKISENSAKFWLGKNHTEETKAKISESKTGVPMSEEYKEWKSDQMTQWHATHDHPMSGKHHTDEAKAAMSEKLTGRKKDPEEARLSGLKRRMPKDREQAIVDTYLGGMIIAEMEAKFETSRSAIYRVLKRNDIKRERPRDNALGTKHTEESKVKMSQARTEYWDNKKANENS